MTQTGVVSDLPGLGGVTTIRAVDLCSGPGGVTTGYKAAGVTVIAAFDNDKDARATYQRNHPEVRLFEDDLLTLEGNDFIRKLKVGVGEVDILTACVPCQTFSTLGRRTDRRRDVDSRNHLVGKVAEFAAALRPSAVVMENVPPLAKNERFRKLVHRLRQQGYGTWFDIVNAADFGVPQRRRRLVLIALQGKPDREVPVLSPSHPLLKRFCQRRTVRDAFRLLRLKKTHDRLSRPRTNYPRIVAKRIAAIPPNGGSRSSLPQALVLKCHKKNGHGTAAGNVYGRMVLDDVAPTLTTRCTTPSCGRFLHPWANRPITLREAACLQTFPVDYEFEGGTMSIQAQIGNAVPPRLAEAIAVVVSDALQE